MISIICLVLNLFCSIILNSVEFIFAKLRALNGGIKNKKLKIEINQKGSGNFDKKFDIIKPKKRKFDE